jgi:hypothetical protein
MEEYLLEHNVTMSDFWVFVVMWVAALLFLILLWRLCVRIANKQEEWDGGMTYFATIGYTVTCVPILALGAWHFIRMIAILWFG